MRRWQRPLLDRALEEYLDEMQRRIDSGAAATQLWKAERQRARLKKVVAVLAGITGPRSRCMYCEDSRGTDVDHFRPQSLYRDQVFRWLNFLWVCANCNRCKLHRFPCDAAGNPLLLDPTVDDPWDHLFFDPDTAELAARWDIASGEENPRGKAVLETLSPLRHQAVTEGRLRTLRALRRTLQAFQRDTSTSERSEEAVQDLLAGIEDAADYGIAVWFFLHDGRDEEPFRTFRERFPAIWKRAVERVAVTASLEATE